MTHADLTDAVRASETLAPSSAERHGTYPNRLAPEGKRCPACDETKSAEDFGPNRAKRDGLQTQCRACRYPLSDQRQGQRIKHDAAFRARRQVRQWAYKRVKGALASGRLVKPSSCEKCGAIGQSLQGHHWHEDYANRPLEVEWLCSLCHGAEHANQVVPGELRMPNASAFEPTRDHASRATNAGHDGGPAAPSQNGPPSCPHCTRGTTTGPNGESWRCSYCGGSAVEPLQPPRAIPGTPRHA